MPAGFNNGTTMFADNVSFDGTDSPGKVTTDGQLLIGSTVAPNIRVGTLASGDGSVTITNGAGTIDLSVAGGGAIETINGDSGSVTGSTVTIYANNAGNINGSTVKFVNSGTTSTLNIGNSVTANTLVGVSAGNLTLSGIANTGFGQGVLNALTSGGQNTGVGQNALVSVGSGSGNSAFGYLAGQGITTGVNNNSFGSASMSSATGSSNNAFGTTSLQFCSGSFNTAMGHASLNASTTGVFNAAFGVNTLSSLVTGTYNLAIGANAGSAYTGAETGNILIGPDIIGTVGESQTIRIGSTQTRAFMAGIAGISVSNQQNVVIDSTTGQLGSITGNTIQEATVTLTSAQIKSLNANPIALVPAQGAGKVIVPISIISKFLYGGTNVFVAAALQSVSVFYGTALQYINGVINNVQVVASTSSYSVPSFAGIANTATSNLENVALNAYNPILTEISGNAANDNTITFVVKYYVVTI